MDNTSTPVTVLENDKVRINLRNDFRGRSIGGDDKTDKFNEPRFFTQNKRGLDKQWAALTQAFTPTMTYREAIGVLSTAGAKVHDYCAMD